MKKLFATFCIVGTAFALSACETGTTYDSGANFATTRTAGDMDPAPAAPVTNKSDHIFKAAQTK